MQQHRPTVRVDDLATAIHQAGRNLERIQRYVYPFMAALGDCAIRINRNLSGIDSARPARPDIPEWEIREIAHGSF